MIQLLQGDCREVLQSLGQNSVDSIVTDPPYELGFMGKKWDASGVANDIETWVQCLDVLKPGGHLLAFSGSRTYHRMVCAIEDAGFEIRDQIMWVYGSGFPKSHNLEGDWDGWGTALKPAHEPIVVARRPLEGTVAANVGKYGTGALNIEGCRIPGSVPSTVQGQSSRQGEVYGADQREQRIFIGNDAGRWPANLIHDGSEEVLAAFPQAAGQLADAKIDPEGRKTQGIYGAMKRGHEPSADSENAGAGGFKMRPGARRLDEGSAARFFYCAKASKGDRNQGCDDLPLRASGMTSETSGQHITRRDGGAPGPRANHHPTVKPTELMRYLVRLVTPPGGLVLDPFCGSGSTGRAAVLEGFSFTGIELDPEYIAIARARIENAQTPLFAEVS